jgi:hypothetical protein
MTNPPPELPAHQSAVAAAIDLLNRAGVDARLSETWRGGEHRYIIVLVNIDRLDTRPCTDTLDDRR